MWEKLGNIPEEEEQQKEKEQKKIVYAKKKLKCEQHPDTEELQHARSCDNGPK